MIWSNKYLGKAMRSLVNGVDAAEYASSKLLHGANEPSYVCMLRSKDRYFYVWNRLVLELTFAFPSDVAAE